MCMRACAYNVETKLEQKERTEQSISCEKILRFLRLCDDKDTCIASSRCNVPHLSTKVNERNGIKKRVETRIAKFPLLQMCLYTFAVT